MARARSRIAPFAALGVAIAIAGAAAARPAMSVTPWKPRGISSAQFESHAAFDPLRTGELYFVRSSPSFEGWRILTSRCGADGWSAPRDAPFAGDGVEADPYFTADGTHPLLHLDALDATA